MTGPTEQVLQNMLDPVLTRFDLEKILKKSRSTILRWELSGFLPKPFSLGPRSQVWRQSTIKAWLSDQEHKVA